MKILQVATLITPDNAYGGPIRVALNQVKALRMLGHEVDLISGSYGYDQLPECVDGVTVRTFRANRLIPGTGFAGLSAPQMFTYIARNAHKYDVVHIHLARDLITLPAAEIVRRKGIPYVLQTHGMIDESKKKLAALLDRVLTHKVVAQAKRVFYLTPEEKQSVQRLFPTVRQEFLPNGVPVPESSASPKPGQTAEVLYLARLQKRKRPLAFVEAADDVLRRVPGVSFALVGPDEGEATHVTNYISENSLDNHVAWQGPIAIEATLRRMSQATIYVLPSVNEPFPMSVLEAMSLGLPVIVTRSNGLAPAISSSAAGLVTEEDVNSLSDAISILLNDVELRKQMGMNGRNLIIKNYSIDSVVRSLLEHYGQVSAKDPNKHPGRGAGARKVSE